MKSTREIFNALLMEGHAKLAPMPQEAIDKLVGALRVYKYRHNQALVAQGQARFQMTDGFKVGRADDDTYITITVAPRARKLYEML